MSDREGAIRESVKVQDVKMLCVGEKEDLGQSGRLFFNGDELRKMENRGKFAMHAPLKAKTWAKSRPPRREELMPLLDW